VNILFDCTPSVEVALDVKDVDGSPVMASFQIRDARGRVYPATSRRLAPTSSSTRRSTARAARR